MASKFGELVIALQLTHGVSSAALVAAAGVSDMVLQEILDGDIVPPHATVKRLADALKTPVADLLDKLPASDVLHKLTDIEIFAAGTWNGDKYSVADLDHMVAAFDGVGYRPPVKLGHTDDPGAPAFGWVEKIWRVGNKLLANFMDLPTAVFIAIKNRRYDSVSSEIFWNLKRDAAVFPRALKAVALLGAGIPGVAGLKPLREAFNGAVGDIHVYKLTPEEIMGKDDDKVAAELTAAQTKIAELTAQVAKLQTGGDADAIKTFQTQ